LNAASDLNARDRVGGCRFAVKTKHAMAHRVCQVHAVAAPFLLQLAIIVLTSTVASVWEWDSQ